MPRPAPTHLLRRLAGAAATAGLALAGLVAVAGPASAAACSGTTGVTVVVDNGKGSISTKCASGDPSTALKALTSAGFSVDYPQQFPGSVVCRINGYPSSDPCVRMPPADAYWAFFHAKRGGSWVYSSSGVTSYDPAPGTVVGFRFGSGQAPGIAPPAPTKTSEPAPTKTTTKPKPTTSAPKPTTPTTATAPAAPSTGSTPGTAGGSASARPTGTPSASPTASASTSPSPGASSTDAAPSASPSDLAAAPTAADADGGGGPGTLLVGGALVLLVGGAAGWAAWKRRA